MIMAMSALSVALSVFVLNLTVVMDTPDPVCVRVFIYLTLCSLPFCRHLPDGDHGHT